MTVEEAAQLIETWYGFPSIYYPGPMQLKVFINVNGKTGYFIYETEELAKYGPECLLSKLDDDLFLFARKNL